MSIDVVIAAWRPILLRHLPLVLGAWAHLVAGAILAFFVLWDAHRRNSRHARLWAWCVQLFPLAILAYLVLRPHPKPLHTAFGVVQYAPDEKEQPRPFSLWLGQHLTSPIPALGQFLLGGWFRAIAFVALIALSATLYAFQQRDVRESWLIPKNLLPEARQAETVTVNFRVPPWLGKAMAIELVVLIVITYLDRITLADGLVHGRSRRTRTPIAYYRIAASDPVAGDAEFTINAEGVIAGSSDQADFVAEGDGILPRHVAFYVHHDRRSECTVRLRCLDESATVLLDGEPVHEAVLSPGSEVTVGQTAFRFLPLNA